MLAERIRFQWLSALLVVPLAFAPGAKQDSAPEQSTICLELPVVEVPVPARVDPSAPLPVAATADQLYRAKDFAGAANAARMTDPNLAELYDQLALQWTIGMSPSTKPSVAFPALREAWKLDTVLGGAFGDEIHARITTVVPAAAVEYYARRDLVAARQAVETADILGIHDVTLEPVKSRLAR